MKRDISPAEILNALLADWHRWQIGRLATGRDNQGASEAENPAVRVGWDSADDEVDNRLHASTMQTIDFHVSGDDKGQGGMGEPHRSAIYALARNCYAGNVVWRSPRLPRDSVARNLITQDARDMLLKRLITAGVM